MVLGAKMEMSKLRIDTSNIKKGNKNQKNLVLAFKLLLGYCRKKNQTCRGVEDMEFSGILKGYFSKNIINKYF